MVVLFLVAGSWGLIETGRLRRQLQRSQTELAGQLACQKELEKQEAASREQLGQITDELMRTLVQLATLESRNVEEIPATHLFSFALTEGLARASGKTPTLRVPPNAEAVALKVTLEVKDYRSYAAALRTAEGAEVWRWSSVRAVPRRSNAGLVLRLPAPRLARNDYTLSITGITTAGAAEEVGQFYFRVER